MNLTGNPQQPQINFQGDNIVLNVLLREIQMLRRDIEDLTETVNTLSNEVKELKNNHTVLIEAFPNRDIHQHRRQHERRWFNF